MGDRQTHGRPTRILVPAAQPDSDRTIYGHDTPTCRGCYHFGTACGTCYKCRYLDPFRPGGPEGSVPPVPVPAVGERYFEVRLSEADIRALVGAPDDASVTHMDTGPASFAVVVRWHTGVT